MAEIDNMIVPMLQQIQGSLAAAERRDEEMLRRLGNLETKVARVAASFTQFETELVEVNHRLDALDQRFVRIEKRLDLVQETDK